MAEDFARITEIVPVINGKKTKTSKKARKKERKKKKLVGFPCSQHDGFVEV